MRALVLLPLLALGGCASAPQDIHVYSQQVARPMLRDSVPQNLLSCLDEPSGSKVSTNRQAASYVLEIKRAGRDCRQKLSVVGNLIKNEAN